MLKEEWGGGLQRDPVNDSRAAPAAVPRFGSSWFLSWLRGEPSLLIGSHGTRVCVTKGTPRPQVTYAITLLCLLRKRRSPWQRMAACFWSFLLLTLAFCFLSDIVAAKNALVENI